MPGRRIIAGIRRAIPAVMLATLTFSARAAGVTPVALQESIKEVEMAPATGTLDPHTPFITRRTLKPEEAGIVMDFEVALRMRNFAELQARVARGEHIPVQEMGAKYAPLETDYTKVSDWLLSQGFQITRKDNNHLAIFVRGKVSQIQQAFQTTFGRVAFEGNEYTSAVTAPSVPTTLSPLLVGINGLQPHIHYHRLLVAKPASLTGTNPPYLPSQIAQAYNANGLYGAGITGTGQTIAIAIDTFPNSSDLTSFWSTYSVNQTINNISFIQVVSGTLPAPSGEETLDTEWSSSIAPAVKVRVYAATSLAFSNLDQVYQQIYTDVTTHPEYGINQMSMSYGLGETYEATSQLQTDDQYFMELTSAGVTVFASSGDAGASPNSSGKAGRTLQPESPAVDPYVTGVGGTSLTLASNGNENAEVVWNNSYGASGGGISTSSQYFARPSWQVGTGVPSGSTRLVPDVALTADPNNGAVVILNGAQVVYGGTSWSSPTWAGFCALINQNRAAASFSSLGLLGPYIYPLLGTSNFRDITSGNNIFGSRGSGYSAGTGYDLCTGVGVPLVQTLAQSLLSNPPLAPMITDGPPPTTGTIGLSYSFTYQVTGNPAPTFALTSGNLPPGLNVSSAGLLTGVPTQTGVYSGTVTASNGVSPNATQDFTITIQQAPAITNAALSATIPINQAYSFSYTSSGYPAPTFSVTAGALPTGLMISTAGVISGTPTVAGLYTGTVDAGNGVSPDATQSFSIAVQQAPTITNLALSTTIPFNQAYSFTYMASGYPAPTFTVTAGTLPPGLTLSPSGAISGSPTMAGTYTGTIDAGNGVSPDSTQDFSITIEPQVQTSSDTDTPTMPPWALMVLAGLLLFFGVNRKGNRAAEI